MSKLTREMQILNSSNLEAGYWMKVRLEVPRISMIRFKNWPHIDYRLDAVLIGLGTNSVNPGDIQLLHQSDGRSALWCEFASLVNLEYWPSVMMGNIFGWKILKLNLQFAIEDCFQKKRGKTIKSDPNLAGVVLIVSHLKRDKNIVSSLKHKYQ